MEWKIHEIPYGKIWFQVEKFYSTMEKFRSRWKILFHHGRIFFQVENFIQPWKNIFPGVNNLFIMEKNAYN